MSQEHLLTFSNYEINCQQKHRYIVFVFVIKKIFLVLFKQTKLFLKKYFYYDKQKIHYVFL